MIDPRIDYERDAIALESVESFKKKKGVSTPMSAMDAVTQDVVFKNELYSKIAERMPTYALNLMGTDYTENKFLQGLFAALTQHSLSPEFIAILLQSLEQRHDPDAPKARAVVGALLVDIVTRYTADHSNITISNDEKKKKKDEDEKISPEVASATAEAKRAAHLLLGELSNDVKSVCAELEDHQALLIAGCIATGGAEAVKKIIAMDYPVTAEVFNIVIRDREVFDSILRASLLLEAEKYTKLTANQKTFIESLKRWVFTTINSLADPQAICQFLISTYGSAKPTDTKKYLIQIKDCPTSYGYLLAVARQLIVKE